jgi:hypothetical protein
MLCNCTDAHALQMFWLDVLNSLPRLRLSEAQMKIILFVMKQIGCKDVPSHAAYKKLRVALNKLCGASTVRRVSELGNIFYTNDPRTTFAMVRLYLCIHLHS